MLKRKTEYKSDAHRTGAVTVVFFMGLQSGDGGLPKGSLFGIVRQGAVIICKDLPSRQTPPVGRPTAVGQQFSAKLWASCQAEYPCPKRMILGHPTLLFARNIPRHKPIFNR
jgi:hypothetical protein